MKTLIVISSDLFVRNYLQTDALSGINRADCWYIAQDTVTHRDALERRENFAGYYHLDNNLQARHNFLLDVLMWRYRDRCRTFRFRFFRMHWPHKGTSWYSLRRIYRILKAVKYFLWGSKIASLFVIPFLKRRIPICRELEELVNKIRPRLVVFPSAAYDPAGPDLVRLSRKLGFKTLFLIDNWDNLSSKSVLWEKPDHLAVWGQQSKEHAITIHGVDGEAVTKIGTPRFEQYFDMNLAEYARPYDFEYYLFCGCAVPFDEISALQLLDKEISEQPEIYANARIIYRPHPWRQKRSCFDSFKREDFRNVEMDRQLQAGYTSSGDTTFQPDLRYYPALLGHAKLVIAPLTTMIIESLVCGTRVLALTYDDGVHFTSPHNVFAHYLHFEGIDKIHGLTFCRNKHDLGKTLRDAASSSTLVSTMDIRASLKYFLYHDAEPYSERLKRLVMRFAETS